MKNKLMILLVLLLNMMSSCAFGRKISYQGVSTFSPPVLSGQSAIAVSDKRPYVLSKDKNPDWVGLSRALTGIPYGVHTQSGKPLCDDLGLLLTSTFNKDGVNRAYQIVLGVNDDLNVTLSKKNKSEDLLFLFTILEWKTDVYFGVTLSYDVNLQIFSGSESLVTTTLKGSDKLGGSIPNRSNLAVATADIFGALVNDVKVVEAVKQYQTNVPRTEEPKNKSSAVTSQNPREKLNSPELETAKERLEMLKKARTQGVLTEEEYQQKRKAVVDNI